MEHYQNRSCPEAVGLLQEETITYSVLIKILQEECADIFTDLENVIVCHSGWLYPVWIWCRDVEDVHSVAQIIRCIREELPMEQGYVHIMSYELLEKLRETDEYFRGIGEKMGLLSYRLDTLCDIQVPCDGYMSLVRQEEIPSLVGVWQDMRREMEGHDLPPERCLNSMHRLVNENSLFAWRIGEGTIVALTGRGDQGVYSKISSVYTLPAHRRRGYAMHLVHAVTKGMLSDGLIPILYTDAGYRASNECYQKLGYRQVGRLISICK